MCNDGTADAAALLLFICLTISHVTPTNQTSDLRKDGREPGELVKWPSYRANRLRTAIILAAVAAMGFGLYRHFEVANEPAKPESRPYMPIADPPVDPNRPDLIGEPRIGE